MTSSLYKQASALALITIGYNIIEGIVSTVMGHKDETLALFGFGLDSFVEVLSGIGIYHYVRRFTKHSNQKRDQFEKTALKITAVSFFILCAGLTVFATHSLYTGQAPISTQWGIIISAISLLTMGILMKHKLRVGKALDSAAIIADARCTLTCFYLSLVLLTSGALFALWQITWADAVGAVGIAYFALIEGKEAWQKSRQAVIKTCGC